MPEGLEPYDRWVEVSLDEQILVADQGLEPKFITLVSRPFALATSSNRDQMLATKSAVRAACACFACSLRDSASRSPPRGGPT
jgi:hypothetical protein